MKQLRNVMTFDVETVPDPRIVNDPETCEWYRDKVKVPATTTKPESIEAHRDKKLAEWRGGRAALEPWCAKVVAVASHRSNEGKIFDWTDTESELSVLSMFAHDLRNGRQQVLGGHNIAGFDIPLITYRCGVHDIELPRWWPCAGEYLPRIVCDTMVLFHQSVGGSLEKLARGIGLPSKLGHGSEVLNMDEETLRAYVRRDVEIESALIQKFKHRFIALRERELTNV